MNEEHKVNDSRRKIQRKWTFCREDYKCGTDPSEQRKEQDIRISKPWGQKRWPQPRGLIQHGCPRFPISNMALLKC